MFAQYLLDLNKTGAEYVPVLGLTILKTRIYLAEFIGTFALVFAGCGAIIINDISGGAVTHMGIAVTFGLIVMVMIHTVGDVSGAHLNPAVTIAFWLARCFEGKEVLPYIACQCGAALSAAAALLFLFPQHETLGATLPVGSWQQSFVLEILLTFFLMFVIINVAEGSKEKGLLAGITIGATVGLEALFAGPISGASMNPARSLGPALVSGQWQFLWLYIAAPVIGASLAILSCKLMRSPNCCRGEC